MKRLLLIALAISSPAFGQTISSSSSRQSIPFTWSSIASGSTNYIAPSGVASTQNVGALVSANGILSNLYMRVATTPSAGQSYTFTVYVGAPGSETSTALTCSIAAGQTTCSDTTDSVAISAGQAWAIQAVIGGTNSTGQGMSSMLLTQ